MIKVIAFTILFSLYIIYSGIVFTKGTENYILLPPKEMIKAGNGKLLFQQHNCISCHQLFGLGGYLGPELTAVFSDTTRGEVWMRAFLQAGGTRMPNFHFNKTEMEEIISYLKYVDAAATTYKAP